MAVVSVQLGLHWGDEIHLENGVVVTGDFVICTEKCTEEGSKFLARIALGALLGERRRLTDIARVVQVWGGVNPREVEIPFFERDDAVGRWLVEVVTESIVVNGGFSLLAPDALITANVGSGALPNIVVAVPGDDGAVVYADEELIARVTRRLIAMVTVARRVVPPMRVWWPVAYGLYTATSIALVPRNNIVEYVKTVYATLIPDVPFIATEPAIAGNPFIAASRVDTRMLTMLAFELNAVKREIPRRIVRLTDKPLLSRLILETLRAYTEYLADKTPSVRIANRRTATITVWWLLRSLGDHVELFDVEMPEWLVNGLIGLRAPKSPDSLFMLVYDVLRVATEEGVPLNEEMLAPPMPVFVWRRKLSW